MKPKPHTIALSAPKLDANAIAEVTRAIEDNWITAGGPFVTKFENSLQEALGTQRDLVALNSGTSALHLALILAGVQAGDSVLCQTMTYVATANPIAYLGAMPIFIDSEAETYNMCPEVLENTVESLIQKGNKPKAIIVVHSYGMPAKIKRIAEVAKKYHIVLIEDAAEALGSKVGEQFCGLFGDYGILSFNGNKLITTGGGGALISKNTDDATQVRHLASQAKMNASGFEHDNVGYNYIMPGLNAALGIAQLKTLHERVATKRKIHQFYAAIFDEIDDVDLFESFDKELYSNYWLNVIQFKESSLKSPEGLRIYFEKRAIESRFLWTPLHLQGIYTHQKYFGNATAEEFWKRSLCLPSGTGMTADELDRIKDELIAYFSD